MKRWLSSLLAVLLCAQSAWAADHDHWNQGGLIAPNNAPYLVQALSDDLDHERRLVSGVGFLVLTDGGPNGDLSIGFGTALPVANGGTGAESASAALINLIGTPTKGKILVGDGSVWNVLAVGTDGYVLTASSAAATGLAWSTTSLGSSSEPYVVMSLSGALSAERALAAGTGLSLTDGGANGNATFAIDSTVATLTGSQTLTNKTLTSPKIGTSLVFDGTGSNDYTITFSDPASARSVNFPDLGNYDVVLTGGAQTIAGVKTLSSAPVLSTGTVTVSGQTLTFPAATDTIVVLAASQTLTNKTLTSAILGSSLVLDQSTQDYTITWNNPAAARAIKIEDVGGTSAVTLKGDGDAYTNGGVAYGNGSLLKICSGGSEGYVLTLRSNVPTWEQGAGASPVNGGRLTLTSGSPVAYASAQGTIYWTPYEHGYISLWDGSKYVTICPGEKSLSLTATSGSNYDVWGVYSGGTLSLSLSGAWSSATSRGYTVNQDSYGIYSLSTDRTKRWLGTIYASGTNQVTHSDSGGILGVFNADNRVKTVARAADTTTSWTYTSLTVRARNNNTTNGVGQVTLVRGIAEDPVVARSYGTSLCNATNGAYEAIGIDSTSTISSQCNGYGSNSSWVASTVAEYQGTPGVGKRVVNALEYTGTTSGTCTHYGNGNAFNSTDIIYSGIMVVETWQ